MPRELGNPNDTYGHAFADFSCRFALDTLLRSYGFRIYMRPKKGMPIWKKGSRIYSEKRALKTLNPKDIARAKVLSETYWDLKTEGDLVSSR